MAHTARSGFTLLELMVTTGILVFIGGLAFTALISTNMSVQTATSASVVQGNVRETLMLMSEELQLAAKRSDNSLTPPLQALTITPNPAPGSPVQITFQVPMTGSGRTWSRPIIYRYINEDTNGNNVLDPGEDIDGDGVLTRRFVRLQDINGDGTFNGPGERRPLGTSNDISDAQIQLVGDMLTITLTSTKMTGGRHGTPITATAMSRIYPLN